MSSNATAAGTSASPIIPVAIGIAARCQSLARAQWLAHREANTNISTSSSTVPEEIAAIAFQNKRVVYDILFRAAAEKSPRTISPLTRPSGCRDRLQGACRPGQNLLHHPHLDRPAPAAGSRRTANDGSPAGPASSYRSSSVSPVPAVVPQSPWTRRSPLADGAFSPPCCPCRKTPLSLQHLARVRTAEWVVFAKPPFAGPHQVLSYVGRYTHRIAISNSRLLAIDDGKVRFRRKDYRRDNRHATMTLTADEFIRRFLSRCCERLPAHPLLRLPLQSSPTGQTGALSAASRRPMSCRRRRLARPAITVMPTSSAAIRCADALHAMTGDCSSSALCPNNRQWFAEDVMTASADMSGSLQPAPPRRVDGDLSPRRGPCTLWQSSHVAPIRCSARISDLSPGNFVHRQASQ